MVTFQVVKSIIVTRGPRMCVHGNQVHGIRGVWGSILLRCSGGVGRGCRGSILLTCAGAVVE